MRLLFSCAFLPFFLAPLSARDVTAAAKVSQPPVAPPVAIAPPMVDEEPRDTPADPCAPADGERGLPRSIGTATHGRLEGGRFLAESELIHHVDAEGCHFWGTEELVGAVRAVASAVAEAHPGHRLTVGELSKRDGGDIIGHASHENGRDVDLGFYFVDADGQPYEPDRLLHVRRDGTASANGEVVTFDVDRNWALVESLLSSDEADVSFILVGWRIRRWLLAHARTTGVDEELYERAARVLIRPRRGRHPHRNHFHVRIYCPETHEACRDRGRLWDWVAQSRARRAPDPELSAGAQTEGEGEPQSSGVRSAASAERTASSRS